MTADIQLYTINTGHRSIHEPVPMPPAKPKLHPLKRHLSAREGTGGSLAERAYKTLHAAIQSSELKPGTRLRELKLTEWFGVSRTPIREALKRLENDGFIVNEPNEGLIVAKLDTRMVSELYEAREVLEGAAAAFAARHASDGEIAVLREIVKRDNEIGDNPALLAANNRLFHEALYRSAHNRYLQKTLSAFREAMSLHVSTTLSIPGRSKAALEQHNAIVTAIENRKPAQAEKAARDHIKDAYRLRLRLLHKIGEDL
jgi:DNA-binding GntR family transcriptional regulator